MSYALYNPFITLCRKFSRQFWVKALELGYAYGWRPLGTSPPPHMDLAQRDAEWDGTYTTNDGQIVRAEDARALAAALERSLEDISDAGVALDWDPDAWRKYDLPEWLSPAERELIEGELQEGSLDILGTPPLAFFAGEEKYYLVQFIRFCRLGSFAIL